MLRLTNTDIPVTLPFTREAAAAKPEGIMDEQRIMDAIEELEAGLAELHAEADAIDDLLAPIPFGINRHGADPDDDRPWAA